MDENQNPNVNEVNEEDDFDNIVVLTDQNGVDTEFEFLDIVKVDDIEYVILLPVESADDGEVVIFRIEGEDENETYVGVDNVEEAEKVFNFFKEKAKDEFNFTE